MEKTIKLPRGDYDIMSDIILRYCEEVCRKNSLVNVVSSDICEKCKIYHLYSVMEVYKNDR